MDVTQGKSEINSNHLGWTDDFNGFSDAGKSKFINAEQGLTPRSNNLSSLSILSHSLPLFKSKSICNFTDNPHSPLVSKTDVNKTLDRILARRRAGRESETENEGEPKARLNSLISIMVSTIMCLAGKCPIPKPNIQATKLFLSTIVNDDGETPRNIKGLIPLLRNYDGPHEGYTVKTRASSMVETKLQENAKSNNPPTEIPVPKIRSRFPSQAPIRRSTDHRNKV